jgi:predicted DNA repair protein MutK
MAGGLAALLDDIAALARLAAAGADDVAAASAKAGSKALGVVIDDAAVTPQYVQGIKPQRELPIIWRITKGSLRNKLLIILPILLLLSVFAPWLLTPILMLGGLYLSFEGAEKIWELVRGKPKAAPSSSKGAGAEDRVVSGAVRTDLILSAEIMVISMNAVNTDNLWMRAAVLVVIAIGITALVYGAVGLLVKMDDIGLAMASDEDASEGRKRFGRGLVGAMPRVMEVISYVGMVAMLWVGGHILLVGTHDLGLAQPYGLVHHLEGILAGVAGVGAVLAWLVNTFFSFVLGLVVGAVVAMVVHFLPFGHHGGGEEANAGESAGDGAGAGDTGADGAAGSPASR